VDEEGGAFAEAPKSKDFIIEALKLQLAYGDPSKLPPGVAGERTRPRCPVGMPKVMLAIGGQAPKAIRSVECYDFKVSDFTSVVAEMKSIFEICRKSAGSA